MLRAQEAEEARLAQLTLQQKKRDDLAKIQAFTQQMLEAATLREAAAVAEKETEIRFTAECMKVPPLMM